MPAKIAAIVNHAGGVAKTTTALNLGYSFAQQGRRVLLIDLDPQADLSERLGLTPEAPTLAQVLTGRKGPPRPITAGGMTAPLWMSWPPILTIWLVSSWRWRRRWNVSAAYTGR